MQIVQRLAGYSMGQADIVRRAMSKKHQDEIDAGRHTFVYGNDIPEGEKGYVPGCIKNHICDTDQESERVANEIYDSMIDFAKYAFNKSHAACYAVLSMQTAWLKYCYPAEYMAALLTSVMDSSYKMVDYLNAAKDMGIKVLPPDVNTGVGEFSVEGDDIRFGLDAIKGIGENLVVDILNERNRAGRFVSYDDFLTRCIPIGLKKNQVENLVKSGACDCFGYLTGAYINDLPKSDKWFRVANGAFDGVKMKRNIITVGGREVVNCHNEFLQHLLCGGIITASLWCVSVISVIWSGLKRKEVSPFLFGFIGWLIQSMLNNPHNLLLTFAFIFAALSVKKAK